MCVLTVSDAVGRLGVLVENSDRRGFAAAVVKSALEVAGQAGGNGEGVTDRRLDLGALRSGRVGVESGSCGRWWWKSPMHNSGLWNSKTSKQKLTSNNTLLLIDEILIQRTSLRSLQRIHQLLDLR